MAEAPLSSNPPLIDQLDGGQCKVRFLTRPCGIVEPPRADFDPTVVRC